jgi:hypothetical protein
MRESRPLLEMGVGMSVQRPIQRPPQRVPKAVKLAQAAAFGQWKRPLARSFVPFECAAEAVR